MNFLKEIKNLTSEVTGTSGPTQEWYITAERAEGLRDKDRFSKSDPYLKIEFGGKHVKTRTIKNDLSPYWNETFHFKVASGHVNDIRITVMDSDIAFDDTIGNATISRADLPTRSGEEKLLQVPIFSKQQASGIVHLRVKLLDDGRMTSSTQSTYQSSNVSYPSVQQTSSSNSTQYTQPPNYNTSFNSTQQPYSQTQPSYNQNPPLYNNQNQPPYQNQYNQGQMPPTMNQQFQPPQQQYTNQPQQQYTNQPPQQSYTSRQPQSNYGNQYDRQY